MGILSTMMGVVRIHKWTFVDYAMGIACICTKYVQETPTDVANVSKLGHKGGVNCMCIFPKMIYLRKVVLLNDFASMKPLSFIASNFCSSTPAVSSFFFPFAPQ